MPRIPATKVRQAFSEALDRVAHRGERITLQRRGKDVAALVPIEDLRAIEAIEDKIDREATRKARKEKSIPYERVRKELGLK